jgi:hypothetical protein
MRGIRERLANPWRQMVVVNAGVMAALTIYKLLADFPFLQYLHLIVDYQFGFTKRALIGAIVAQFIQVVPLGLVYVLGVTIWIVTLVLFLEVFRRTYGFSTATLPLFVFLFGSPFFFKNFIQNIGYFDIYGCALALAMLLIPARTFAYVAIGALGSAVLLLVHPIHMLMYLPTISLIVVIRYYFAGAASVAGIACGLALGTGLGLVFIAVAFYGNMTVPIDQLTDYLRRRTARHDALDPGVIDIWYRTIATDIAATWGTLPKNLLRFPVYAALIALHWPVIRYFDRLLRALANDWHRRLTLAGLAGITLGYVIIGMVEFDYPRWFSGWAVCMFLILHALKDLPARDLVPLPADDRQNRVLGWIVTVLPRVGTNKPF